MLKKMKQYSRVLYTAVGVLASQCEKQLFRFSPGQFFLEIAELCLQAEDRLIRMDLSHSVRNLLLIILAQQEKKPVNRQLET